MKNIFVISEEDIQCLADYEIGRRLRIEELKNIKSEVESGLECWGDIVVNAIRATYL